jgi:hypothetical protein
MEQLLDHPFLKLTKGEEMTVLDKTSYKKELSEM